MHGRLPAAGRPRCVAQQTAPAAPNCSLWAQICFAFDRDAGVYLTAGPAGWRNRRDAIRALSRGPVCLASIHQGSGRRASTALSAHGNPRLWLLMRVLPRRAAGRKLKEAGILARGACSCTCFCPDPGAVVGGRRRSRAARCMLRCTWKAAAARFRWIRPGSWQSAEACC